MKIGVIARADEHAAVREFFELFKTPWEFVHGGRRYDVLIDAAGDVEHAPAQVVVHYGSAAGTSDVVHHFPGSSRRNITLRSSFHERIPVYGSCAPFATDGTVPELAFLDTGEPAVSVARTEDRTVVRVGYDLFREVAFLLTDGQPPAHAGVPVLELHIALLRRWILAAGVPVVEIPPIPAGHPFIACLTHDIDHPSVRLHRFDPTIIGFLYRATVGSVIKATRHRLPVDALRRNVAAALSLPLVQLGWVTDFWARFDRYLEIEDGFGSTFFVIPTRGQPGRTFQGEAPRMRAASYGACDISNRLRPLVTAGCEIGVHGIDAWLDSARGTEEREAVARASAAPAAGVRMHWLYFDAAAPQRLEAAGFDYDSTFGYNETVGFRAGTLQAFKPLSARELLELPLHVMDTALFYPAHLNLTADAARDVVFPLVDAAQRYGGALTVNWHDRSLAPERLWGSFYVELVDELRRRAAWCPTALQATAWFRRRRSAVIDTARMGADRVRVGVSADRTDGIPGLRLRVYRPESPCAARGVPSFTDLPFAECVDTEVTW